ncbi:MAG: DUF4011 domain-containing protein, partial [Malacoplasma sp.]|nr:DUF4011 domain-containing protein [Malacoplasma sp.]
PFNTNHISISNFVDLDELVSFFDGITDQIMINSSIDFEEIKQELSDSNSVEEFLKICENISFSLPPSKLNLLNANFKKNKVEVISLVLKYLSNLKTKFLSLQRSALQILKNSGSWNLYLTRYFLKGLTPVKFQSIKAPIILIQVEIVEEHGNLFIRKKEEKELNQKLVVFLQRETGKNDKLISEYEKTTKDVVELKKDLEEILNLEFPIIKKNEDLRFVKETSTNVANNFKELFIEDSVCLGIFEPGGGSLKNDLEHIISSNSYKDIFESPPKTSIEQIKDEETNDFPIIQIDKLDVYQRYAVRSSLKDNTVIFGPPGTGKSEVISNIIANVLFNSKDVMMVSEKAAALEVLKKRLKSLSIFMLLIYDVNNKKEFFDSIQNLAKFIGNSWLVDNGNIYKDEIKEEKIRDTLLEAKNFKNLIHKFEELKKFKHNNQTYIDFLNDVIKIGNFKTLLDIKNSDIVFKIESFISSNNISKNEFFELLNNYV